MKKVTDFTAVKTFFLGENFSLFPFLLLLDKKFLEDLLFKVSDEVKGLIFFL